MTEYSFFPMVHERITESPVLGRGAFCGWGAGGGARFAVTAARRTGHDARATPWGAVQPASIHSSCGQLLCASGLGPCLGGDEAELVVGNSIGAEASWTIATSGQFP